MDGMILLKEAQAAGLKIEAIGNTLRIRGPKRAEPIARQLLKNKQAVLAELKRDTDVTLEVPCWDPETAALIHWFLNEGQHRIPRKPFLLYSWARVVDQTKFIDSLLFDIAWGPSNPRNLYGALIADLKRLKELFSNDSK